MSREKVDYRPILADILEWSNGRRLLSQGDVAAYLGISRYSIKRKYGIGAGGITAPSLAMILAR